jgi:hypothetical protein
MGVIGTNLLIVSPYLVMLVAGYPFLEPSPRATIPQESAHLLEVFGRAAPLVALACWGIVVARRRGDRLGRALAAQIVGAWLVWAGYHGLSLLEHARERDEAFFWARFLTSIGAGIGAWDLAGRVLATFTGAPRQPSTRAAALALLALPLSFPYWWEPARMDPYFRGCRRPLRPSLLALGEFLRHRTEPDAVVAGDRDLARWVSALGARRVLLSNGLHLPRDTSARLQAERALLEGVDAASAAAPYRVGYVAVAIGGHALTSGVREGELGSRLLDASLLKPYPAVTMAELRARADLEELLYEEDEDGAWVALFRVKATPPR